MAHFRGTVQGMRGKASRLGGSKSGLETSAASWEGAVRVYLWYDAKAKMDMALVELQPHGGQGTSRTLYRGPVSGAPMKEEQ